MTLPPFGLRQLNKLTETMNTLTQEIPKSLLETRPGPGGRQLVYVSTSTAIHQANTAFGPAAWSSEIKELTQNFLIHDKIFRASYTAIIRVTLENGCFHEDVGSGNADNSDQAAAIETAKKTAVSDGVKRCLRYFGDFLGRTLRSGGSGIYAQVQSPTIFEELVSALKPLLSPEEKHSVGEIPCNTFVTVKEDDSSMDEVNQVPVKIELPATTVQKAEVLTPEPTKEAEIAIDLKSFPDATRKLIKIVKRSEVVTPSQDPQRAKIVIKRKSQKMLE